MTFPELKRRVLTTFQAGCSLHFNDGTKVPCNIRKPDVVLIEDASSGSSIGQELAAFDWDQIAEGKGDGDTYMPIEMVKVDRDKVARANAATPMLESGYAMLP
ncbi:MAG: hypothetical protein JO356_14245, partial [Acidobacteria bacterium]|nr:hypothetical protein [Acidobacteriota bacterium]